MIAAVLILTPFTLRRWRGWGAHEYRLAALFGTMTAAMNMSFYVAIDHLPLGNGVAIEFIGPITVAAWATRTRRNWLALGFAVVGVGVLSGTEIGDDAFGLMFIFLAAAFWAGYIVLAGRVARRERGLAGLALGLVFGMLVTAPVGALDAGAVLGHSGVLAACLLVGLLSTALPYALDQHVLRRISTRRFAVLQALLPVVATVMGALALDQRPSRVALIGIALVVAGVAVQDQS